MASRQESLQNRGTLGAGRLLVVALLVATCFVGSGLASLNCKICHSIGNYEECLRSPSAPCTASLVNTSHLFLSSSNPTLRNVSYPGPVPEFQCFQVNYTVGVMWHYQMGCTYATTKICEGWKTASKCLTTRSNVMGVPGRVKVPLRADYNPNGPPIQIHPRPNAAAAAVPVQHSTQPLNCKICHSTGNYEECLRSPSAPCTASLVNTSHLFLSSSNPTLRNVSYSGPVPEFQCFQVNYTVGVMWHYQMGCTYATTKICEGWKTASKCRTTLSNVMGVPGRVKVPLRADYNPNGPPIQIHPRLNGAAAAVPVQRSSKSVASGRSAIECLFLSLVFGWVATTLLRY
ncbi:uncharacterized protein LOC120898437 [Anopheles arabiensis]|uniref:Uncharacterized protein n=1 Tax=Anopheles arabiensis TaxID=7173 RepID=A0A182HU66_ANOAR|nr:uncharacterized protein LOC120898437 [Anopheles arabiensis]